MTPVEIMVEAFEKEVGFISEGARPLATKALRAALLALAEAHLPHTVTLAGRDAAAAAANGDVFVEAETCFRAMLRALAKEESQ